MLPVVCAMDSHNVSQCSWLNDLGALQAFSHGDQVICETFTDEVNVQTDL